MLIKLKNENKQLRRPTRPVQRSAIRRIESRGANAMNSGEIVDKDLELFAAIASPVKRPRAAWCKQAGTSGSVTDKSYCIISCHLGLIIWYNVCN